MKKFFKTLMLAFVAISTVSLMSCGDDNGSDNPDNPQNPPEQFTLANTSWLGQYTGTYQDMPAVLTWTLDFSESTGSFLMELNINGQDMQPQTISFNYTFDPESNTGIIRPSQGQIPFTYDKDNNTITMAIAISASGEQIGGQTVFHQI